MVGVSLDVCSIVFPGVATSVFMVRPMVAGFDWVFGMRWTSGGWWTPVSIVGRLAFLWWVCE